MQIEPGNNLEKTLRLVRGAGFDWVKVQLRWEDVEKAEGQIDWSSIDHIVRVVNNHGVRLMFSVVTAPEWSRPADTDLSVPGPPADPQDYARFVGALVERHKGKIHAIEVWNEQNLWYEWGGKGELDASGYVALLKAAYQEIKQADSNVIVLSGGLTPTGVDDGDTAFDDVHYLEMMYEAGVQDFSDAVAAHPSGYNNPPDDTLENHSVESTGFKDHPSFYFRRFEQYREVMERFDDGDKEIWFTEFGWASSPDPAPGYEYAADNTEQDQAQYLVRAFEIAQERGYVGVMFIWNLNYAPVAEADDPFAKGAFSIIRPDWTRRPAYRAVKQMSKIQQSVP
jgi:GH35 family endo-1,4-beta-xylanase